MVVTNCQTQTHKLIETLSTLPSHWPIIPCKGKQPLGTQWQNYPWSPQSLLKELKRQGTIPVRDRNHNFYEVIPTGIGVLCGQNSQEFLVAVDCDGKSAYEKIAAITSTPLPTTVTFTSGRPGRAQYLLRVEGNSRLRLKSRKISTATGEALELRGNNLQSVLPPSVHPETGYYRWFPGCCPNQVEVATAPLWVIEQMSLPEKPQKSQRPHHHHHSPHPTPTPTGVDVEKVLLLLEVIHPRFADDYDSWIKVGMALKWINPNLLRAWDEWSQLSPKYKPGECEYKWHSFNKWGITIRTLYKLANLS